jgi:hypothetical protein
MKNIYLGIDGGLSGALCVVQDKKLVDAIVMPVLPVGNGRNEYDCQQILKFLTKYPTATIILEKAQFTPKLGGIASFAFGKSYGMMIGMLSALGKQYHLVAARTWQKEMLRDTNTKNTKDASAIVAKRLFPEQSFLATARSKKIHSGLTDAALIAEYGRRHNL